MGTTQSIKGKEGTFLTGDGLKLYYQTWSSQASPPKAALVVLHGLKDHSSRYTDLAARLTSRGFHVFAFDLRGHGRSEGRRVYVRRFSDYVDDLSLFLSLARQQNPDVPVFLFGHSMGGTISTRLVMTAAPGVRGVVLSAAATKPGADINPLLLRVVKFMGAVLPRFPIMNLPNALFSRDPAVVKAMATDPYIYQKKGPARTAAEFLGAMQQIQKEPTKVDMPLLILHGTADRLTNPDGSRALYQNAGSKDKTLKLYPGLYHDLVHEPEKERIMGDIQEWLEARIS